MRVALAGGQSQRVGAFRYYFVDERWEWSDAVQEMHGYAPGTMPNPTMSVVLGHKHPDDRAQVLAALDGVHRSGGTFSTRHRIIDVQGRQHSVIVVTDELTADDSSDVVGIHGFYVDASGNDSGTEALVQERVTSAVEYIAERRMAIEQAKGMLMMLYDIDEAAAFELLRWRSQECNVKLRALAEQLVADFRKLAADDLPARRVYDRCLMHVHENIR